MPTLCPVCSQNHLHLVLSPHSLAPHKSTTQCEKAYFLMSSLVIHLNNSISLSPPVVSPLYHYGEWGGLIPLGHIPDLASFTLQSILTYIYTYTHTHTYRANSNGIVEFQLNSSSIHGIGIGIENVFQKWIKIAIEPNELTEFVNSTSNPFFLVTKFEELTWPPKCSSIGNYLYFHLKFQCYKDFFLLYSMGYFF